MRQIKQQSNNANSQLSINKVYALVNHRANSIEFGPSQGMFLDDVLRNKGIGTYALNEIVVWLRENFQDYSISPFEFITPESASEEEDKDRRNKFLENFGFTLGFTDVTQRNGTLKAKKPSLIKSYVNHEKIDEIDIEQYFFNLINDKNKVEKEYGDLKVEFAARGEELLGGMPKGEIIKYTVIASIGVIVLIILLTL